MLRGPLMKFWPVTVTADINLEHHFTSHSSLWSCTIKQSLAQKDQQFWSAAWNSLPCKVKSSNILVSFKSSLKSHLFKLSYCIVCVCVCVCVRDEMMKFISSTKLFTWHSISWWHTPYTKLFTWHSISWWHAPTPSFSPDTPSHDDTALHQAFHLTLHLMTQPYTKLFTGHSISWWHSPTPSFSPDTPSHDDTALHQA